MDLVGEVGDRGFTRGVLPVAAGVDTILLGRATYEDLVRRWPAVGDWGVGSDVVLRIGDKINNTPKLVVTSTLSSDKLVWGDFEPATRLSGPGVEEKISQLKERDGGDIITFGSPTLVQALTNAGLVDEYRVLIHPVVVNEGRRLFDNLAGRTDLQLVDVTSFPRGSILVTYRS